MRIGFDVAQTCQERVGCAWYSDSLARAMIAAAPENQYILYHQFGRWINQETNAGTYIEHPSVDMPFWGAPPDVSRQMWQQIGLTESLPGNPEIIQSNSFQVVETAGAKLVFVVYDVSFWACPEFTTEANRLDCQNGVIEALTRADGFLFISESAKNEFETVSAGWLERNRKPAVAIPLASRLHQLDENEARKSFWLVVGSMEPRKNYNALFSAVDLYWQRSKHALPVWIAAPTGWKNDELKRKAKKLESRGQIRLLGYVDEEDLGRLYQQALALIFPSWYEGFGLPVLEAMGCGCPVICSDRTSLPEIGGDAVIYVDPEAPESICKAMLLMEEDAAVRHKYRGLGFRRASQFSWHTTATATLDFYREVLETENSIAR
jgi:glycosyltransferase involved in cell wall biosynthesis